MCDKSQALEILKDAYHICNPLLERTVTDAYLYGSYARGDYHADSDVDILFAADLSNDAIIGIRRKIACVASDLSLKHDVTVSLTVKPASQFHKNIDILPFYQNVVKDGLRYEPQ